MEIANTMLTAAPYTVLPMGTPAFSPGNPSLVAREFSAMFFNILLQSSNMFGPHSSANAMGAEIWNGLLTQQLAQEMAAQHASFFGGMLFGDREEE
jgi:Rod binding domain-containing protein